MERESQPAYSRLKLPVYWVLKPAEDAQLDVALNKV